MKLGTQVCLVGTDGYMPPVGACGVIVEGIDDMGDYGVELEEYPCPHPPGTHWYAHRTWLVPLLPLAETVHAAEKEVADVGC